MPPSSMAEAELANLIRVSWILLIPLGVLLSIVLCKLMFILHGVSELMTIARYELSPVLKELSQTATHLEVLSSKAVSGVETIERRVQAAAPVFERGTSLVKTAAYGLNVGLGSLVRGLQQSFSRKSFR